MDVDIGLNAGHLVQMMVALLMVIMTIMVAAWLMRRINGGQSRLEGEFRVVSGLSLGARERIVLVQVGDKQLLIGVAPGRVQTLYVLDEPILTDDKVRALTNADGVTPANSPFARTLRSLVQRGQ